MLLIRKTYLGVAIVIIGSIVCHHLIFYFFAGEAKKKWAHIKKKKLATGKIVGILHMGHVVHIFVTYIYYNNY